MKKDISIIIVNYNVKEYIISCIESIYKHSKSEITFEIIVIDNNSSDGSANSINKEFPKINLIENKTNTGFTKAVNQAAKKSIGKYLFILNPDTLFTEDSLIKFVEAIKNQKQVGALGPRLISNDKLLQKSYWKNPSLPNTLLSLLHLDFLNFKKNYNNLRFDKITQVDTISGCAFFLKKEIFFKMNGFNEDLFWMEDIDLCKRLNKKGLRNYYLPTTTIIHYKGKSAETNFKISISNQLISKIKYFKIHHSKLSAYLLYIFIIFLSLIKLILLCLTAPFSGLSRKKFSAYLFSIRSLVLFRI